MISNCGHDENGDYEYGQAGDQTGTEWEIKPWYRYGTSGWDVVLRFEDRSVAQMIADIARAAANNNLVGYDQKNRYSYWEHLQASNYDPAQITVACEADCSSGVVANVKAAGYRLGISKLKNVPIMYTVTSDLHYKLKSAGAIELRDSKYLTSDKYLRPGDILLAISHHTATNLDMGSNASWDGSSGNVLSKGSTGADVKDMQTKLIACGYSCGSAGADGDFGEGTETALKNFQRDYNLVIDGIFGDASRAKLNEVYSSLMEDGFVKIKISTTSSTVRGIKVCGNQVPVCSKPGDSRTIVKHLNNGVLLDCDYRANTNGSCFYHYSEGWYYFRDWGAALNIGLWSDGENTYYFGTDCKMKTGWITVGNTTYFFRDWGAMLKHAWIKTNGVWKYVDKNGVYVPSKDTTNQPDTSDGSIIYTGKV